MTNTPWKANTILTACIKLCGQNLRDWVIVSGSKTLHTICNINNKATESTEMANATGKSLKVHTLLKLWAQWMGRILDRTLAPVCVGYWVLGTASTAGIGGILDTGLHEGTSALALWHCHRRRWVGWLWRLCQTNWGKLRAYLNAWPSTGRRCRFR